VDCVDEQLLNKMAQAGCVGLYFGIETGSERMQKVSKKRLDLKLVEPTFSITEHLGIETTASFITGYHEEREQDLADTLDLLGRCFSPTCLTQLHMLAPEPGTPMFAELGDQMQYDGYAGPYNAFLVGPRDEQLVINHPAIFSTYHYYPAAMPRWYYKFAVESVDVLRRAGPIILRYVLRAYGGQLSRLVFELLDWADRDGRRGLADTDLIEDYISATFGTCHHVTSLFRYAFGVHESRRNNSSPGGAQAEAFDPHERYQLSSQVRVLSDIHDCELLIDQIKQNPNGSMLLEDSETGERTAYLVSVASGSTVGYKIDPGLETMLSFFVQPRSCSEVTDVVRKIGVTHEIDANYFAPLIDVGILVAEGTTAAANGTVASRLHVLHQAAPR